MLCEGEFYGLATEVLMCLFCLYGLNKGVNYVTNYQVKIDSSRKTLNCTHTHNVHK